MPYNSQDGPLEQRMRSPTMMSVITWMGQGLSCRAEENDEPMVPEAHPTKITKRKHF